MQGDIGRRAVLIGANMEETDVILTGRRLPENCRKLRMKV